jgi:hypothetical protein
MRTVVRLEARRPGHTAKGSGKHHEAPKAELAELRLAYLPNGLQAIENLETCPATAHVDSMMAKTVMTIITHVEADPEENTPLPPTWRAKCRWISCRKNMGYHATDRKI